MDFEFCLQDPSNPQTRYLYEAIIGAATNATAWRGMYAFASRGGVDSLIEDPVVHDFMRRGGQIDLVVGIDAVTNRQTLERMQELEARHRTFHPRVFWNSNGGLFHPKLSDFSYADGRRTLIVGSGNLTPGGLRHNFEGYSVIKSQGNEILDLSSLDGFLTRHTEDIRVIDQEALERAALNASRPVTPAAPRVRPTRVAPAAAGHALATPIGDRILVAQVPKAGGRWSQAHFNDDVVTQFFRITDRTTQRVYLTRITDAGIRGDEEVRPCVYSTTNKNNKIEISAAHGLDYPADAPPILIFRERQLRCFDYMLLMPEHAHHADILHLSEQLPSVGRGLPRVIIDASTLARVWPNNPLLRQTIVISE